MGLDRWSRLGSRRHESSSSCKLKWGPGELSLPLYEPCLTPFLQSCSWLSRLEWLLWQKLTCYYILTLTLVCNSPASYTLPSSELYGLCWHSPIVHALNDALKAWSDSRKWSLACTVVSCIQGKAVTVPLFLTPGAQPSLDRLCCCCPSRPIRLGLIKEPHAERKRVASHGLGSFK